VGKVYAGRWSASHFVADVYAKPAPKAHFVADVYAKPAADSRDACNTGWIRWFGQ